MKWYLIRHNGVTHNVPTEDIEDHTVTTPCWCRPQYSTEYENFIEHNNFMPDNEGNGEEPSDGKYN